jgi:hypothetical protein
VSWSLHSIGKTAHVAHAIASNANIPDPIKTAIAELLKDKSVEYLDTLVFEGYGHGASFKIEMRQMQSAPPPPITKGYVS